MTQREKAERKDKSERGRDISDTERGRERESDRDKAGGKEREWENARERERDEDKRERETRTRERERPGRGQRELDYKRREATGPPAMQRWCWRVRRVTWREARTCACVPRQAREASAFPHALAWCVCHMTP